MNEKQKARQLAQKIPINRPCVVCGSITDLERHHSYYKKPMFVHIVCRNCHCKIHTEYDLSYLPIYQQMMINDIRLFTAEYECIETMEECTKKMQESLKEKGRL